MRQQIIARQRILAAIILTLASATFAQAAFAYAGTANLTFVWGGSASGVTSDQVFQSAPGPVSMPTPTNSTMFSMLGGANFISSYDANFASAAQCVAGAGVVPAGATTSDTRKYGCRYTTSILEASAFAAIPLAGTGPVGMASGTLTVTDTTLTGTLRLVSTTDEPTGATTTFLNGVRTSTSVGDGLNGYNYRTLDGSPFGNAWYGTTTAGTLTVALTGTFTASFWSITGGAVAYADLGLTCQQGGFGGNAAGTLCTPSSTGGGFNPDGSHLSWGMDPDGIGSGIAAPIDVRDATGATIATLSGVLATLIIDPAGNIGVSDAGEFRRAAGSSSGCLNFIRYDSVSGTLTCGSITSGVLVIIGSVVPIPAAAWLLGSALGVLGWMRRRNR